MNRTRVVIALAVTAAAVRLVPLHFLHPLNWDELEFFMATKWIAEGRVPFRDFWEHHTPLTWFVFAPIAALAKSPGVEAVIALRWAQIAVWVATFWLANLWMRTAGLDRFARWSAMALAISSSLFMLPAIEYRVDSLAAMLYIGGLVLVQRGDRRSMFFAGVAFCLAGLANLRFGPLLVVTVLLIRIVKPPARVWGGNSRAQWSWAGGFAALGAALLYFASTGALGAFWQQVILDNLLEKHATAVSGGFVHRLLVPFGIRIIGSDRLFELAAVDVGGMAVLLFGATGGALALSRWRAPDDLFVVAALQLTNLLFIAAMKFIYNYHFLLVVVMMVPLIALAVERVRWRDAVTGVVVLAWCVNAFASIFRGKELDRAYQDLIMREAHARTRPGDAVWSGIPWAIHHDAAYRLWFLPELARIMVRERRVEPYRLSEIVADPPGAVVFDHNALVWVVTVQRELAPYFVRHYIPVWRNLWLPGMNARLRPGGRAAQWIVPRDGEYRVHASEQLASHVWFRDPLGATAYKGDDASRLTFDLPPAVAVPDLQWSIDGAPINAGSVIRLRKGQRVAVTNRGAVPLGLILYAGSDRTLFRQPPPGVSLEGEATRVTHVPRLGATIRATNNR